MKVKHFVLQVIAGALAMIVAGAIHYEIHPLTEINTFGAAIVVAFSFFPGMIIGYAAIWIERLGGEEEPDPAAASVLCALLWFVYLFRALTLLVGLPVLSNWTQGPVNWLVKLFQLFERFGS